MRVSSGKSLRSLHFDCGTVSTIGRDRMKLPRRKFLHLTAGAAALSAISRIARAQTYPSRPVRIIVGQAAGSGSDIAARLLGQRLSERLGQPRLRNASARARRVSRMSRAQIECELAHRHVVRKTDTIRHEVVD
jgi:hypothetical protein